MPSAYYNLSNNNQLSDGRFLFNFIHYDSRGIIKYFRYMRIHLSSIYSYKEIYRNAPYLYASNINQTLAGMRMLICNVKKGITTNRQQYKEAHILLELNMVSNQYLRESGITLLLNSQLQIYNVKAPYVDHLIICSILRNIKHLTKHTGYHQYLGLMFLLTLVSFNISKLMHSFSITNKQIFTPFRYLKQLIQIFNNYMKPHTYKYEHIYFVDLQNIDMLIQYDFGSKSN